MTGGWVGYEYWGHGESVYSCNVQGGCGRFRFDACGLRILGWGRIGVGGGSVLSHSGDSGDSIAIADGCSDGGAYGLAYSGGYFLADAYIYSDGDGDRRFHGDAYSDSDFHAIANAYTNAYFHAVTYANAYFHAHSHPDAYRHFHAYGYSHFYGYAYANPAGAGSGCGISHWDWVGLDVRVCGGGTGNLSGWGLDSRSVQRRCPI